VVSGSFEEIGVHLTNAWLLRFHCQTGVDEGSKDGLRASSDPAARVHVRRFNVMSSDYKINLCTYYKALLGVKVNHRSSPPQSLQKFSLSAGFRGPHAALWYPTSPAFRPSGALSQLTSAHADSPSLSLSSDILSFSSLSRENAWARTIAQHGPPSN
jgi:hypothetical protein